MQAKTTVKVDFNIQSKVNSRGHDYIVGILEEYGQWLRDPETGEPTRVRCVYTYYTYDPVTNEATSPPIIMDDYIIGSDDFNNLFAQVEPTIPPNMDENKKIELMYYIGLQINMADTFGIPMTDITVS